MPFQIFQSQARTILSPVSGFLREAGFTHSLTPSRNCTFGCTYCYVPTMRVQGGLQPDDWKHWGQWTTFKANAGELLASELRGSEIIYCSPLTDPYQPAEESFGLMRRILTTLAEASRPPRVFVIQTRGPLILRDLDLLARVSLKTRLRVSFSVTTNREDVRRTFEPHCGSITDRWLTIRRLRKAGIPVTATLAPILPCDPEELLDMAMDLTSGPVVADPFHVRSVKKSGATTREPAQEICRRFGWEAWLDPAFHAEILETMRLRAAAANRIFSWGAPGFGLLVEPPESFRPSQDLRGIHEPGTCFQRGHSNANPKQ